MSTRKNNDSVENLRSEFQRLDSDNDGFITIKEFREFHAKRNNDETAIAKAFAAIDSDKDGRVTLEEFIRAYEALE